jgi:hypothetical protein
MKNEITAWLEFYYKGKKITARKSVDLDCVLESSQELPDFFPILAKTIELDKFSYEYELMLSEQILFEQAKGLAAEYLENRVFDFNGFKHAWLESKKFARLQAIAFEVLNVDDLNTRPALRQALNSAYESGRLASDC